MQAPQEKTKGLVVFDVEGVLIPQKRYLFFEVGRTLGLTQFIRIIVYGLLYEIGTISLKSALGHVFRAFKGLQTSELLRIFKQVPLMAGTKETLETLKNDNWKTALISSGLPTIVVQDLASTLEADYAFGFDLETKEGILTGEIWGDVLERNGKLRVLKKILKMEEVYLRDCVVVADDRNNASIFLPETLKIGYNPDFLIRLKSDIVVSGKLPGILPSIKEEPRQTRSAPSKNEIIRETMHASGCSIPVFSTMFGLPVVVLFILVVTLMYVMSELARMERKNLPVISSFTHHAATHTELYGFATAPIFFALGILLTLLLFPSTASSAAIAIFALGDSTASIFGKTFGKRTLFFNKGKTLEGSIASFFFAFLAGTFFIAPSYALLGAIIATVVESLPLPLNDNLVTPIITGLVLTLVV